MISVRRWSHFHRTTPREGMSRFRSALVDLTCCLVEDRGAEVTYVSTCQGTPEYAVDDSTLAAEIVSALPARVRSRVVVDRAFHTPQTLRTMLEGYDVAIATRLHFAILAMMAEVVTVPIAYEFKTAELFAELNLGRLVEDVETVTSTSLLQKVDWALGHKDDLKRDISKAVARETERAIGAATLLRRSVQASD